MQRIIKQTLQQFKTQALRFKTPTYLPNLKNSPQEGNPRPQEGNPRPQEGNPRPQEGNPRPRNLKENIIEYFPQGLLLSASMFEFAIHQHSLGCCLLIVYLNTLKDEE